jgi:glycosyltransferase involved in cell wall biosynthesis
MHRFKPATDVGHIFNRDAIFRCVIIGALNEGKGQDQAIKAVAILACRGLNVELRILGKGGKTYTESLLALIKKSHLEGRVKLEGHVKNPASFINRADVLLMCSRSEAFGRVTIEGMLSGKPVIGSDSGATAELIRDGFNGLLYEPDNPADLADKIILLVKDPAKARFLGENGKIWAEQQFSKVTHAANILEVINPFTNLTKKLD